MTTTWPLQRDCNRYYGNPRGTNGGASAAWEKANLVLVPCPWRLLYAGKPVRGLRVHKKCADSLARVLAAIWARFGRSQAAIEQVRMHVYGGGYNFRLMRGGSNLSMHSWGCALDFDPEHNGLGNRRPAMDRRVIEEFEREGWEWGGHWSRADGMHFQAAWTSANPPRLKPVVQVARMLEEPEAYVPIPSGKIPVELDPADAGAPQDETAEDPAVVRNVQQRLRALGYFGVGTADGDLAGMTRGAIVTFKHEHGLVPETPELDQAFLAALAVAPPRQVPDARANATAAEIAPKVETVQQTIWSRLWAKIIAIPAGVAAGFGMLVDSVQAAREKMQPVLDVFSAVPWWVYALAVGGGGVVIWLSQRKAEQATVDMYRQGRVLS